MWILPAWLCYQTIWRGTQIPFLFHSRNHIVLVWPLCVPACASFQCYCLSPADHFFESSLMACDWYNVVVVTVEDFFDYFRGGSPTFWVHPTLWLSEAVTLPNLCLYHSCQADCVLVWDSTSAISSSVLKRLLFILSQPLCISCRDTGCSFTGDIIWNTVSWWCFMSSLRSTISSTSVSQLEIESEQLEEIQVLLSWMSVPNSLSCMWNAEPYATSLTIVPSNLILSASGIFFGNGTAGFILCIFCFNLSTDSRSNLCYFDGLGLNSMG